MYVASNLWLKTINYFVILLFWLETKPEYQMLFNHEAWMFTLHLNGVWDVARADSYCSREAFTGWWAVPVCRERSRAEKRQVFTIWMWRRSKRATSTAIGKYCLLRPPSRSDVLPVIPLLCISQYSSLMCTTLLVKHCWPRRVGVQRTWTGLVSAWKSTSASYLLQLLLSLPLCDFFHLHLLVRFKSDCT